MLRFVPLFLAVTLLIVFTSPYLLADDLATDKFAGHRTGETRNDNGLKLTLVWCPPGRFKMGSPLHEPGKHPDEGQVEVNLTRGFWLGKTEVTQGQWTAMMKTSPWEGEAYVEDGDDYPATFVDWTQCHEFCKKFTEQERKAGRLPLTWRYDLPTEAQWEYACRAGTSTRFSFGDNQEDLYEYAWYGGLTQDGNARFEKYAHKVGLKKPNNFGLHDMHGNVYEWCRGWYGRKYVGGDDPPGERKGTLYPSRGGAWDRQGPYCRSADRECNAPDDLGSVQGFRISCIPDVPDLKD
ncbi:MAG: formylglycine-generating enzyme family protein [Planctomycetales bacterium]